MPTETNRVTSTSGKARVQVQLKDRRGHIISDGLVTVLTAEPVKKGSLCRCVAVVDVNGKEYSPMSPATHRRARRSLSEMCLTKEEETPKVNHPGVGELARNMKIQGQSLMEYMMEDM